MTPTEADAHRRAPVKLVRGGKTGQILFVHRRTKRATVRMTAGYHLRLAVTELELDEQVSA